jgi:hypothetical protein
VPKFKVGDIVISWYSSSDFAIDGYTYKIMGFSPKTLLYSIECYKDGSLYQPLHEDANSQEWWESVMILHRSGNSALARVQDVLAQNGFNDILT